MMFMLGLMFSCTYAFFLTYPKMALLTPDRGTNFLIWKQIKTGRRGFPFPRTGDYLLLVNEGIYFFKINLMSFFDLGPRSFTYDFCRKHWVILPNFVCKLFGIWK